MTTITKEQLAKLPVWAQNHIEDIERERFVAVRALNEFTDSTTESPFFHEKNTCTGEATGPSNKRAYIQAHRLCVEHAGIELEIHTMDEDCIGIRFSSQERGMADVAIIPDGRGRISFKVPKNMRK